MTRKTKHQCDQCGRTTTSEKKMLPLVAQFWLTVFTFGIYALVKLDRYLGRDGGRCPECDGRRAFAVGEPGVDRALAG